jgi:hypothetical protein
MTIIAIAIVAASIAFVLAFIVLVKAFEWDSRIAYLPAAALSGAVSAVAFALFAQTDPYFFREETGSFLWISVAAAGALIATGFAAALTEGLDFLRRRLHDREREASRTWRHDGGAVRVPHRDSFAYALNIAVPVVIGLGPTVGTVAVTALAFVSGTVDYLNLGAAARPVYNARAEPNAGAPDALLNGVPTRLFFNIGPLSARNLIGSPALSQRLSKELNREENVDLSVTMTCYVCTNMLPQTRTIRYGSARQRSTVAEFAIVADREVAAGRKASTISFSIRRRGVELDFLNVPIQIFLEPAKLAVPVRPGCPQSFEDPGERPDLVVHLARDSRSGLKLGFEVNDSTLAQRLASFRLTDQDGGPALFNTKVMTPEAVTVGAGKVYEGLRELVKPEPLTREQRPDVTPLPERAQLSFDADSEQKAIRALSMFGTSMYDKLFLSEDLALRGILEIVEKYGSERHQSGKNLRVLIYTSAIYLPWQLLIRPSGSAPNVDEFWGHKYILGVIPADKQRSCGGLPGEMRRPGKDDVLYAHYWQEGERKDLDGKSRKVPDQVSLFGERFATVLGEAFPAGINTVHEKDKFITGLKDHRRHLQILWTYSHGHSGQVVGGLMTPDGTVPVTAQDVAGQRLDFSQSEFVAANEIDQETIQIEDLRFFVDRPFVFLNGCETGTEGGRGTTELSLPGIFIARGARGVVATEAPIWDAFGYNFAETFLQKLASGELDAGEAMLATRREFVRDSNNPLGLLYSYYGNAAARFKK